MTADSSQQPAQPVLSGANLAQHFYAALAAQPGLTLPGATFASIKGAAVDLLGRPVAAMWINTHAADLDPSALAFAAVRLDAVAPLPQVAGLDPHTLALAVQQASLRPDLPAPPLMTLLHAGLASPAVAFTQPIAVLAAGAVADPATAVATLFGSDVLFLAESSDLTSLAARVADLVSASPSASGMLLGRRGLLTWGVDVESVVHTTVVLAQRAASRIAAGHVATSQTAADLPATPDAARLPALRGILRSGANGIVHLDTSAAAVGAVAAIAALPDRGPAAQQRLAAAGLVSIWIDPSLGEAELTAAAFSAALSPTEAARLEANAARHYSPVVALVPGLGIVGCAPSPAQAAAAVQVALHALQVAQIAGELGGYAAPATGEVAPALSLSARPMPAPRRELDGKIALVTGAASGIGRAIAIRFAMEGACVAACDINDAGLQEVVAEIEAAVGPQRVLAVHCDVSDAGSVSAAYQQTALAYGGLDIAVANAGLAMSAGVDEMPVERWRKILDVNLTGYFLTAAEAFRLYKAQGVGGALIFISSKAGLAAGPGSAAYGSTKAAEMHLARILAEEGGPAGIRVNTVCPDAVFRGSAIWQLGWKEERARVYGIKPEDVEEHYRQRSALKVSIYAEDVAEAVLFLASDRAAKTTGAILTVDGGMNGAYVR